MTGLKYYLLNKQIDNDLNWVKVKISFNNLPHILYVRIVLNVVETCYNCTLNVQLID